MAIGPAAFARDAAPNIDADIDALFSRWTTATPGCAVGVSVNGEPVLESEYSFGFAWIIAGLVTALVLLVAFKTSKRNAMERE